MLRMALTVLQVFSAVSIIALVLIQRGKGADAGAGFGAGASGTVFGARGARTALSRATAVFAAVFMLNSLALAYMGTKAVTPKEAPKSILSDPTPASGQPPAAPTGSLSSVPAPPPSTAPAPAAAVEQPASTPPSGGTPPK